MLIATLAFTAMHVLVKELSYFHVSQVLFFRSGVTALFCLILLKQKRVSIIGNRPKRLILRAILGMISMTLFFLTVQRMPLGASVSLKYLSPVFTAIFAVLFIKEKVRPVQWLFFSMALSGVLLLKGFDIRIDSLSLFLGVMGAVFGGLVYVLIRKIGISEHPLVIINYFMSSTAILAGSTSIMYWQPPTPKEWFMLISIGGLGFVAQFYMTKSFQLEAASRVAPVKYMEVIYSLIIGFFLFGEGYTFLAFLGILMILGGMILNLNYQTSKR